MTATARAEPLFHTVISGAGISTSLPSALPTGADLADIAWRILIRDVDIDASVVECVQGRIKSDDLRLEQLLNVMMVGKVGMPLDALVTVYASVKSAEFNYLHARLTELDGAIHFTVNMDTLLESAASAQHIRTTLFHLHGRWDEPSSIITTISQYLDRLDPESEQLFGRALANKRVLVTGYSARDRDIYPLLKKYPPAELTWLVYPSKGTQQLTPDQRRAKELSPEAITLLDDLRRSGSTKVTEIRETTSAFLDILLPRPTDTIAALRPLLDSTNSPCEDWPLPLPAMIRYGAEAEWRRRLAVAAVLFDQGFVDAAQTILERASVPKSEPLARLTRVKMQARVRRRNGQPWRAILLLTRPIRGVRYREQLKSVANECAAALGRTRLYPVADRLDKGLLRKALSDHRFETALQVATRLAQHASTRGELVQADHRFAELAELANRPGVGLGSWINALTWHADLLKVQGRADEARALLERFIDDSFYADYGQKAYLRWKILEINLVTDGATVETLEGLDNLARLGQSALGDTAYCWLQLTRIGATFGEVLEEEGWTSVARIATSAPDTKHFLFLQLAELARSREDFDAMRVHLRRARRVQRDRGQWRGSRTGKLVERLIRATALAQRASTPWEHNSAAARLGRVEAALQRLGALPLAERAAKIASIASGNVDGRIRDLWQINM